MRAHGAAKRGAGEGGLHGWMGRDFGVCSGVLIYFWKLLRGRRKVAKHINTHTSHRDPRDDAAPRTALHTPCWDTEPSNRRRSCVAPHHDGGVGDGDLIFRVASPDVDQMCRAPPVDAARGEGGCPEGD